MPKVRPAPGCLWATCSKPANPDGAIEAYKQAALLDPKDPEPHLSAGPLLESQNRFADAEQEYKQAFALDPSSTDALTGMANIYMRGHRFTEAEEILRKLVALHPTDAGAHMQLGRMLAADGQNDPAIAELQTGAEAGARRCLGAARSGGPVCQRQEIRSGRSPVSVPAGGQAERSRAALRPGTGSAEAAQVSAKPSRSCWPRSSSSPSWVRPTVIWLRAANENKNYELVIKALDARAKLLPELPIGYFLRATAYDHLREYKPAAENYHRFLETATGNFPDQEWQARHRLIAIEPKKMTIMRTRLLHSRAPGGGFSGRGSRAREKKAWTSSSPAPNPLRPKIARPSTSKLPARRRRRPTSFTTTATRKPATPLCRMW